MNFCGRIDRIIIKLISQILRKHNCKELKNLIRTKVMIMRVIRTVILLQKSKDLNNFRLLD